MPRQISDRTRKVREIVERIPPDKINETKPSDLQPELKAAGVTPRNEQDRQSLYAEFSRRRRKLGLLRTQVKKLQREDGAIRLSQRRIAGNLKQVAETVSRIVDALDDSDVELVELLDVVSELDRPVLEILASLDPTDLQRLKDAEEGLGREAVIMTAYGLGMKEMNEGKERA